MKTNYFFYLVIITFTSCNSYKQTITNDDYKILNIVLQQENIRVRERAYLEQNIASFFENYEKQYLHNEELKNNINTSSSKFILDKEDIMYMRKKYTQWKRILWKNISDKRLVINTVTYPFYNKEKTKAMLIVSKIRSAKKIILLKKENNSWAIIGDIPNK